MTDLLEQVGVALYGPRWQTDLANALGVSDRRLRRWHAGDYSIPPGVYRDLLKVAQARRAECSAAVALIRQHIEKSS